MIIESDGEPTYEDGDELLVKGKAGNIVCLIIDSDCNGNNIWRRKFNIRPDETDRCIVGFDSKGNPLW